MEEAVRHGAAGDEGELVDRGGGDGGAGPLGAHAQRRKGFQDAVMGGADRCGHVAGGADRIPVVVLDDGPDVHERGLDEVVHAIFDGVSNQGGRP